MFPIWLLSWHGGVCYKCLPKTRQCEHKTLPDYKNQKDPIWTFCRMPLTKKNVISHYTEWKTEYKKNDRTL